MVVSWVGEGGGTGVPVGTAEGMLVAFPPGWQAERQSAINTVQNKNFHNSFTMIFSFTSETHFF